VFLYIVFVCFFFLLLLIDHYAKSVIIGEEDYLSLIFVLLFTIMLGVVYYFIFSRMDRVLEKKYKKQDESRYY
jgi:hypothetical protein